MKIRLRVNAPVERGTEALERYSVLAGDLASIEGSRAVALASTNAVADQLATPVLAEMSELEAQLLPWWKRIALELTKGKRKSIELGGCTIGTKSSRDTLKIDGDADAIAEKLKAERWAKPYVRIKASIDKAAVLKAIAGPHADKLKAAGFSIEPGAETFVLERVVQTGTLS